MIKSRARWNQIISLHKSISCISSPSPSYSSKPYLSIHPSKLQQFSTEDKLHGRSLRDLPVLKARKFRKLRVLTTPGGGVLNPRESLARTVHPFFRCPDVRSDVRAEIYNSFYLVPFLLAAVQRVIYVDSGAGNERAQSRPWANACQWR